MKRDTTEPDIYKYFLQESELNYYTGPGNVIAFLNGLKVINISYNHDAINADTSLTPEVKLIEAKASGFCLIFEQEP